MKVVIASHYFGPHVGGVETVAYNQARHLAHAGIDVTVLTSACDSRRGSAWHDDGFAIWRLAAWNRFEQSIGVPFPVVSPTAVWDSYRIVRDSDVVHVHDAFYMTTWLTAFWAWRLGKPLVLTQHVEYIPHPSRLVRAVQRLVLATFGQFVFRASTRVTVVNTTVRDFLIRNGVDAGKIVVVTNGVDTRLFHPADKDAQRELRERYGLPIDRPLALFVGRFVHKKGFSTMLECGSDDYVTVLVGGAAPRSFANDQRFVFLGTLQPAEVSEVYRACDVFVLPSSGEGFPLTVQEAMASGLPVITSNDPRYRIYNLDPRGIRLVDPRAAVIRKNLSEVLSDAEERQRMGEYSLRFVAENCRWSSHVSQLVDVYRALAAEAPVRA
jgi:glycosyltransferase involved in cell wall biosynthesis